MAPRYERVNLHDVDVYDDHEEDRASLPSPVAPAPVRTHPAPSSPPPSFHSRESSPAANSRHRPVHPDLEEAFDSSDDSSDNDDDNVRQRLVRRSTADTVDTHGSLRAAPSQPSSQWRSAPAAAPAATTTNTTATGAAATATTATPFRVYGSGIQSDGVFSNLSARPEMGSQVEKEEQPPTYEQAAADQAPPYWETTILAPGLGGPDEVYLDGMPVGSLFGFLWNGMISTSFQLVGFLLTYLLHSTHAAKNGSRAGLGITLIQYGFYLRGTPDDGGPGAGSPTGPDGYSAPADPNSHDFDPNQAAGGGGGGGGSVGFAGIPVSEWMAYIMMVAGWFVLIRAVSDYLRARRHEMLVLGSPERGFGVVAVFAEGEEPDRVV